jgi:RNA polymerase sigma-70 factor (ECF subfamily)
LYVFFFFFSGGGGHTSSIAVTGVQTFAFPIFYGYNTFSERLMGLQSNLLNFAYTLTLNRDDAQDLLQDTTLKALDNQDKYVDNVNFKGWVFTIMRNIFINNYRKIVRSQTMIDQSEELYHLNLPQDSGIETPEGSFTVREILTCINSFSDEYRVPFSMHVSGFKYHEIAEKMDLPIGTVKSRIFFARQRLQKILKDYNR